MLCKSLGDREPSCDVGYSEDVQLELDTYDAISPIFRWDRTSEIARHYLREAIARLGSIGRVSGCFFILRDRAGRIHRAGLVSELRGGSGDC